MNRQELSRILGEAYLAFPHLSLTEGSVAAWLKVCGRVPAAVFEAALTEAVSKEARGFFPTPGQVMTVVRRITSREDEAETAEEGWAALWGSGKPVTERAQRAAERMYRWNERGLWTLDSMPFRQLEFCRIYNSLKEREELERERGRAAISMSRRAELTAGERKVFELVQPKVKQIPGVV